MNERLMKANLRRCSGWLKMGLPKTPRNPKGYEVSQTDGGRQVKPVTQSDGSNPGLDQLSGKTLELAQAEEDRKANPNAGQGQAFPKGRW